MRTSIQIQLAACCAAVGLLSACSPTPAGSNVLTYDAVLAEAQGKASQAQLDILEDGVITRAELDRAVDAMFSCFQGEGIWYEYEGVNPVDGWRPLYGVNNERPGEVADCGTKHLDFVRLGWEILNEDEMDQALMTMIQSCLEDLGREVSGEERNLADLVPGGHEDTARLTSVQNCASQDPEQFPSMIFTLH